MNIIKATIRNTNTKGEVNSLRIKGSIPAIIYGGSEKNKKISLDKKNVKNILEKENFLSNIISLNLDGKSENVLPKEIAWNPITDEPIHIDFLRIVKGSTVVLEIPVKFINNDLSPGLKRGGVLSGEAVKKISKSEIKKLVVTDTIDNQDKIKKASNIEVLTISNLMGEAIKRISNSNSVSDLFK